MFKVGDRVRVRLCAKALETGRVGWAEPMDRTVGREGVVRSVDIDGDVQVTVSDMFPDADTWTYAPEQLEQLEPATPATPATPPQAADALTLRDQFAMTALTGLIAAPLGYAHFVKLHAEMSYDYADAMLVARNKTPESEVTND